MTNEKKRRAGKPSPQAPVRRGQCGRIPLDELEPAILGSIDPVDEMVMQRLRESLCGFNYIPLSAFFDRKLVPQSLTSVLKKVEFISRWLVLARSAQVLTDVPASILLAEIWYADPLGFGAFAPVVPHNDWFETGRNYASLGAALLDHAFYLQDADDFQPVMYARKKQKDYLAALGKCRLWEPVWRKERVNLIVEGGFLECDVLPIGSQS